MGRGRSGLSRKGGGTKTKTKVVVQGGREIDLSGMPLRYGKKFGLTDAQRKAVEEQEKKRLDADIEYGVAYDSEGNIVGREFSGDSGSVAIPYSIYTQAEVFTHNHPRGTDGAYNQCLGGTFSEADMRIFAKFPNLKTMRASAAEGTYSITKRDGFDEHLFNDYVGSIHAKHHSIMDKERDQIYNNLLERKINYGEYVTQSKMAFNKFLINYHNDFIAGQKKYKYTYTLEER